MATTFVRFSEVGHQCMLLLQWQNKVRAEHKASLDEMRELAQSSEVSLKEAIKELETVLSKSTERQALTWANLVCSIVESSASLSSLAIDFCVALTQSTEQALLRLQILQAIYSALHSSQNERYQLFCVILEFATKTKNAHVVVNSFSKVNSWLVAGGLWANVGSEGRRRVHTLMYHALLSLPGSELTAYQTLVEVLGTYSAVDIQSGIATELAIEAATLAIRLPEVHQCDELLALDAITHLSTNPSHATLHQLLSLFASDSVKGYISFHEKNAEFLTKTGLSHEQCLKKIRLLTLTSVAAQSHLLTYKAIAEHLAVPVDDVEFWIVLAISNHLLDAKMDQIQQTVTINQTNQRVFSTQQWQKLSERLHLWRSNVAGCAAAFEEAASASSSRGSAF